jgi:hypothetical protein
MTMRRVAVPPRRNDLFSEGAYESKSTANEHFLKLEAAVEALGGTSGQPRADQDPATPPTRS